MSFDAPFSQDAADDVAATPFTAEPFSSDYPAGLSQDAVDRMHDLAISGKRTSIAPIRSLAARFPQVAVLKNYLMVAYQLQKMHREHLRLAEELVKEHPELPLRARGVGQPPDRSRPPGRGARTSRINASAARAGPRTGGGRRR